MQVLALDFDGVISDSAPESFAVALATYCELRPRSQLAADAASLLEKGLYEGLLERLRASPLYREFLELMPLGNRAEDFGVALSILERKLPVRDQADYDREREAEDAAFLLDFHSRFYELRGGFAEADATGWQSLLAPYPEFVKLLRARAGDVRLAIATAKDHRSVRLLLKLYGIDDLFPDELVLDKETGISKRAHLEALAARTRMPFAEISFVDDKVNHLDAVASLGVRCALAAWGYNGSREHTLARQRSFLVCELGDVEAQLFG